MIKNTLLEIQKKFDEKFRVGEKAWQPNYEQIKQYIHSSQKDLLKVVIGFLETNPNEDGSQSPNIQHWIERKQAQLKVIIKELE